MIQLHLNDGAVLCVIEPGNIRRLKEGKPWYVTLPNGSHVMVVYTPDLDAFGRELGVHEPMPAAGTKVERRVHISSESVMAAIEKCKRLPEHHR